MNIDQLKIFGIFILKDGVFFNPSVCSIKNYNELYEELLKIGIVETNFSKIKELLTDETNDAIKIGDTIDEYNTFKDDYIKITVSREKLEAYIDITYPGTGEEITYNDVMHKILSEGIKINIDRDKIKSIVKNKVVAEKEVIARGTEPQFGVEAQVILEVDTEVTQEPLIMDDGSVDFRQVNLLKTVEKDQLLAVKIPPAKGVDGIDVFGNSYLIKSAINLK